MGGANTARASLRSLPVHWALLRTLPFGTEGSLLRWEPQPDATDPCTPHTLRRDHPSNPTWQAALASVEETESPPTSRGRVAMGLFGKSKQQKQKEASRTRAPGYHATTPPRLLNP